MRVLHVTPYFAPAFRYGGPPRSILGLTRGLTRSGVEVEVLTTTADGPGELPASPSEGSRYDDVPVRYLPRAFPRRLFGARGLRAALDPAVERADLVHVHGLWTLPGWRAIACARRRGRPVVISPRGMLDPPSFGRHRWRKKLAFALAERRYLTRAAFLHATSESEARSIRSRVPGAPVFTVPNGVDGPDRSPGAPGRARARLGIPDSAPVLTFLGRLHPVKRLDLLAAAFDRVRVERPDAQLVIAGPDDAGERRRLAALFATAGAAVHWTGELGEEDKWALLADSTLLVLCSDSESFGLSAVEALAAGIPVIATRSCPWAEIERAGAGRWVDQTPEAIATAALSVVGDGARARAMGARGRALARERYSWDGVGAAMAERYERVLRRPRSSLIITPGLSGSDGISAMSRLVARALAPVRVLSLADGASAGAIDGVGMIGAGGRRRRFVRRAVVLAGRRHRDVICLHLRLAPLARLLARGKGRLTTMLVGIEAWRALPARERRALERADRVLAISDHTRRRFREANPSCAGLEVEVCHLGVGEALPAPPSSGTRGPFALIVGRMASAERYKGHDLLLEAWPRVLAQCPETTLVVAGDGDDRSRLERAAARLGCTVRFTGRLSDEALAGLFRDCAFFVMPSRDEGFGLVFLEAMRAGKACIGADGAAAELIEDGVTGFLVDPRDAEQMVKTALRLFQDPALADSLGRAGRARWRDRFTEEAFAERFRAMVPGQGSGA